MYTFFVKRPIYTQLTRTQVFRSWKPGSANTLIGQRIGRFQFTREISNGEPASLYQGCNIEDNSLVAIKLFSPEISQDSTFASQFKTSMRQAQAITADALVAIHEAGMTTREQLYVVTDYVNGKSLHEWVHANNQPSERPRKFADAIKEQQEIAAKRDPATTVHSLHFAEQIGQQLALLEAHNLAHHNLSLTKFIVQPDDTLIMLGYGLPSLPTATKKNGRFYPLDYVPAEQSAGTATTIQSNIYSLGVMLYEMLAGSRPLVKEKRRRGARAAETTWRVELADIKPGLADETYDLVSRCLHAHPWNRFASVAELQAAIATALQIETAAAKPFLNEQTAPINMSPDTAVPETVPGQPAIKPVKKRRPTKTKKAYSLAETLNKAAVLPPQTARQADVYEEEERSPFLFILPVVGLLLLLIASGVFFFNNQPKQSAEPAEPDAAPAAAVVADNNLDEPNEATDPATPAPPALEIITPAKTATTHCQIKLPLRYAGRNHWPRMPYLNSIFRKIRGEAAKQLARYCPLPVKKICMHSHFQLLMSPGTLAPFGGKFC